MGNVCDINLKVISKSRLRVRSEPSLNSKIVGYIESGDTIHATRIEGYWYYHDRGWSLSKSNTEIYLEEVKPGINTFALDDDVIHLKPVKNNQDNDDQYSYGMREAELYTGTDKYLADTLLTTQMNGIFGIPYQFSELVDQVIPGTEFGRKYSEKIIAPMPLLFLSPGHPAFMRDFDNSDKRSILGSISDILTGDTSNSTVDEILDGYGRYYSFKFAYDEYYEFVNHTLRILASYMGIGKQTVTIGNESRTLDSIRWERTLNRSFSQYINTAEAIPFYLDSEVSVSENFSNNTSPSMLSQMADSLSDKAREITFLLGDLSGIQAEAIQDAVGGGVNASGEFLQNIMGEWDTGRNILSSLTSDFKTVATGGKLVFPEIWSDSDFGRSYTLNFKFRSPDADTLSIFLNLYVPIIHLIAMAAPQQMGANGYKSPFLVRAFYKGIFNCDMGMITSLDLTRGKESCWNANGLPTSMDVSMTIKDLYSSFFISKQDDYKYINNTALIDYLCMLAGVNFNKPELTRMIETYLLTLRSSIIDKPGNIWMSLQNDISNLIGGFYKVK